MAKKIIKQNSSFLKNSKKEKSLPGLSESKLIKAQHATKQLEKEYSEKKAEKLAKKVEKRKEFYAHHPKLQKTMEIIEVFCEKLVSTEVPSKMKVAIFGALAYLVLPIDVLPDYLPGLGFIDDAAILFWVWKATAPFFVDVVKNTVDEIGSKYIELKVGNSFKQMYIRGAILFAINIIATIICCWRPFGELPSNLISSFLYLAALGYSIYRFVINSINGFKYRDLIWEITKNIFKSKSISKGIVNFINTSDDKYCKLISSAFVVSGSISKLTEIDIPSLERCVRHFEKKFLMRILLCLILYFIFVILVYWFFKPLLLANFSTLKNWQFWILPIVLLYKMIVGLI